MINPDIGN